jgi:hypothetical protein
MLLCVIASHVDLDHLGKVVSVGFSSIKLLLSCFVMKCLVG